VVVIKNIINIRVHALEWVRLLVSTKALKFENNPKIKCDQYKNNIVLINKKKRKQT